MYTLTQIWIVNTRGQAQPNHRSGWDFSMKVVSFGLGSIHPSCSTIAIQLVCEICIIDYLALHNLCSLTMLPSALGALTSLRQLHIASNKLTSLPIQIGLMTQLEVLKANNNR